MTQREKRLVAAVAGVGLLWGANVGWKKYQAALDANSSAQLAAVEKLSDAQLALARGQKARRELNRWRRMSLPTNRDVAESLYQDWLRGQLSDAGLTVSQLADRSVGRRSAEFQEISVEVRGQGTLAQLVDFLCRFDAAGHLHRISSATISPEGGGDTLSATLVIDALIMPDCERKDALAKDEKVELAAPADDYKKRIAERTLFTAYQASAPAGASAEDDPAKKAMFSGATYGARGWRLDVKTGDAQDVRHFYAGDQVSFGKFSGKVVEVDQRRAVIETAEGRVEVRLGQSLGDAKKIEGPEAQRPQLGPLSSLATPPSCGRARLSLAFWEEFADYPGCRAKIGAAAPGLR